MVHFAEAMEKYVFLRNSYYGGLQWSFKKGREEKEYNTLTYRIKSNNIPLGNEITDSNTHLSFKIPPCNIKCAQLWRNVSHKTLVKQGMDTSFGRGDGRGHNLDFTLECTSHSKQHDADELHPNSDIAHH